jgi:ABC-type glycerol-3-phosphate transport system substrate-binding protein
VSIVHIYRKIIEKSRSFDPGRIDHFLFLAVLVLAGALLAGNLVFRFAAGIGRTDLFVSPRSVELFGREEMDDLIREFENLNPELRIKLENQGGADLWIFEEGEYGALVREGVLYPLNSYIHIENGAEQYAVPLVSFMDLLVYNTGLLQSAGFSRPPKTRAEFLAAAKAVSAANSAGGPYGAALGLSPKDPNALRRDVFSWVWAAGGTLWPAGSPEGEPVFDGKTAGGAAAFLGQLSRENALAPGTFEKTGDERVKEFAAGKIAMIIASVKDISFLKKEMDGAFGVTVIPGSGDTAKNALGLSGIYAGIGAGSAHPDYAWTFLVFLAEKSSLFAAALKAVPGAVPGPFPGAGPAGSGDYLTGESLYAKARDIFEASDIARGLSGYPGSEEFERGVRKSLTAAFENR